MNSIKHKIFRDAIAFALVALLMFSQFITLDHYREFHSEEHTHSHHDKQEKHHSESCFICHTQATYFILSDFDFSFQQNFKTDYEKAVYFYHTEIAQEVSSLYSGRAPPTIL